MKPAQNQSGFFVYIILCKNTFNFYLVQKLPAMRKYTTLFAAVIILQISATAQSVGINNNTPHASAALDVTSTTKGVLIPRLTQAQRTAIAGPAKGLLVFDSTSNSFWFHNGSSWIELVLTANAWSLTGNAATNPATQFLGTADNLPLRFRINNTWAGELNPTSSNTTLGFGAGQSITSGTINTGFGQYAIYSNTTGTGNTAHGSGALYSNQTGNSNTALGGSALYFNTTGYYNTAVGQSVLLSNSTGINNTALGSFALYANTSGNSNVAIGAYALSKNTVRRNLVAVGDSALYNTGTDLSQPDYSTNNTAVGSKALFANTIGSSNTANGSQALYTNTTGGYNNAMGALTLYANTTGSFNVAIGAYSLPDNTTGSNNTALGYYALPSNTIGAGNIAIGPFALELNNIGSENTAVGIRTLDQNSSGFDNTAVGFHALFSNTTGNYNTAIGYEADVSSGNLSNATAIGNTAIVDASNKVRIGNTSVTSIGGQVGWTTFSDGRFKKNIKEDIKGLDFILKLRPVSYNFDVDAINAKFNKPKEIKDAKGNVMIKNISNITSNQGNIRYTGFVAQEVEKAASELEYDFSGVDKPSNPDATYGLRYGEFVVPLVKAVQELSKLNDLKDKKIETQQIKIEELQKRLERLEAIIAAR